MNCDSVRKYIYAFADGQLDVKGNCDILDHLKMCRVCGALVDEHQALRSKLAKDLERVPVPSRLKQQIFAATGSDAVLAGAPRPTMASRPLSVFRPVAVAACLLLAVGAVWYLPGVVESSSATITVPRSASAATMIAQTHNTCCSHGPDHQSDALPRELRALSPVLKGKYHETIASLTPDLSRFGFSFESVNLCGVRNKPGCEGAHLIYASAGGAQRLSVFSIPRWDCLDKCGKGGIRTGEGFRRYEVDDESGQTLHIVAWHQNSTTYVCCGPVPFERIIEMVGSSREALAKLDVAVRLALVHYGD